MNIQLKKQRALMREALRILDDITAIKLHFDTETVAIHIKIEELQDQYAETVTELAKLLMTDLNIISITES